MENLFNLKVGDIEIKNPIVLSAMAGITDGKFAASNAKNAGLVILGAFNLDETAQEAGKKTASEGRKEFEREDVFAQIEEEIDFVFKNCPKTAVAVSVRSAAIDPLLKAALLLKEKKAVMELDIHCRQPEFTEKGLGQSLLKDTATLAKMIQKIKETGVVLAVKFRTNAIDPKMAAEFFDAAGIDIIHADAMIEGKGADSEAITKIRDKTRKLVIANNSVDEFEAALEFFFAGADMVSVARAALEDAELIPHLVQKIEKYQKETGWYNSPKHICKNGDNRGMAFCCPPVKSCKLLSKIKEIGFSPQEFIQLKQQSAKGTPLEYGKETCFGSFVWCCKITKTCYYRDMALAKTGLSGDEFMRLKKDLSEKILEQIEKKKVSNPTN
jgi:TIM-barrel protein